MKTGDSRSPGGVGILPLQHLNYDKAGGPHGPWDVDMRSCVLAWRITGRDDTNRGIGHWIYDADSAGDIHGGQLLQIPTRGSGRGVPMWRFATPVVISSIGGGQSQVATGPNGYETMIGGTGRFLPVFDEPHNPDTRFIEITPHRPTRGGKEMWPKFPVDYFGVSMTANREPVQVDLFMPTDPRLIAVNRMADPEFGSLVCDMGSGSRIDLDRMAKLQSFFRVLIGTTLCSGSGQKVIAWNVGPSGLGDTRGGYMFEARGGTGTRMTPTESGPVPVITPPTRGNPLPVGPDTPTQAGGTSGASAPSVPTGVTHITPQVLPWGNPPGNDGSSPVAGGENGGAKGKGQQEKLVLGIGGGIKGWGPAVWVSPGGGQVPVMGGKGATVDGFGFGAGYGIGGVPLIGGKGATVDGFGFGAKYGWVFPPDPPYYPPFGKPKPKGEPGAGVEAKVLPWLDPDIDLVGKQGADSMVAVFGAPIVMQSEDVSSATGVVAMMSQFDSGLMEVGLNGDKHTLGRDADGHEIHSSHVSTKAYYYQTTERDAPLDFGWGQYPRTESGNYKVKVHLSYDPFPQHAFACGARQGLWRWWAESFLKEIPPPSNTWDMAIPKNPRGGGGGEPPPPPPPSMPTLPPIPGKGDGEGTKLWDMPIPRGYYDPVPPAQGGNVPLANMSTPYDKAYRRSDYPFSPTTPHTVTQWLPGWSESFVGTHRMMGVPGIVGIPQNLHPNSVDLRRYSGQVPDGLENSADRFTPVVARIESFGSQQGCTMAYTQKPAIGRYAGGTANGGFALMPPEFDITDYASEFSRPNVVTPSTTYFTAVPGAYWAAGVPDPTDGGVNKGYRWGANSGGDLLFQSLSAAGVPTTKMTVESGGRVVTTATATSPAIQVGNYAGDPSSLANGDIWYNSSTSKFRARQGGSSVDIVGGVSGSGVANQVAYWDGTSTITGDADLTFDGTTLTMPTTSRVVMGAGTGRAKVKGLASTRVSPTQTNGGSTETDLMTYTLPASSLDASGDTVHFYAAGTFANNSNTKDLRLYWGGNQIFIYTTNLSAANQRWELEGRLARTLSGQQRGRILFIRTADGTSPAVETAAILISVTDTSNQILKMTGQGGATNDITQAWFEVQFYNA